MLLDEVIGENFAVIAWGCDPTWGLTTAQIATMENPGDAVYSSVTGCQIRAPSDAGNDVTRVGDSKGRLREWFARAHRRTGVMRPDRFLAAWPFRKPSAVPE